MPSNARLASLASYIAPVQSAISPPKLCMIPLAHPC